ncbi:hypothetical protein FRB94_010152 [Tulasnella sp. JGI-2019a]|nr:hypothetical protein FRB94_010152 [Tulasnella sp. JGI-2019a]KAG9018360.1 hypothetical protein FRB93_000063 [Tulasnella sp. JGI-2019a]
MNDLSAPGANLSYALDFQSNSPQLSTEEAEALMASWVNGWNGSPRRSPNGDMMPPYSSFSNLDPLLSDFKTVAGVVPHDVTMDEDHDIAQTDLGSSKTGSHYDGGNRLAVSQPVIKFVQQLFNLVQDPNTNHLIRWTLDGNYFIVVDEQGLMEIAGFKTKKFPSLHRQLNNHFIHKIRPQKTPNGELINGAYYHKEFLRDRPDLLWKVGRKELHISAGVAAGGLPTSSPDGTKPCTPSLANSVVPDKMGGVAECACKRELAKLTEEVAELQRQVRMLLTLCANKDTVTTSAPSDASLQDISMESQRSSQTSSFAGLHTTIDSCLTVGNGFKGQTLHHSSVRAQASTQAQNPCHTFSTVSTWSASSSLAGITSKFTQPAESSDRQIPNTKKRRMEPGSRTNSPVPRILPTRSTCVGPSTASQRQLPAPEKTPHHATGSKYHMESPDIILNDSGGPTNSFRHQPSFDQGHSYPSFTPFGIDHQARPVLEVPLPNKPRSPDPGGSSQRQGIR